MVLVSYDTVAFHRKFFFVACSFSLISWLPHFAVVLVMLPCGLRHWSWWLQADMSFVTFGCLSCVIFWICTVIVWGVTSMSMRRRFMTRTPQRCAGVLYQACLFGLAWPFVDVWHAGVARGQQRDQTVTTCVSWAEFERTGYDTVVSCLFFIDTVPC